MNHIYIDESGSEGTSGRFIVFAGITISDPRLLEKSIKKLWKVKPQYHAVGEFHANKVDDATRARVLLTLADLPISIQHLALEKSKQKMPVGDSYYTELAQFIQLHQGQDNIIVIDKKDTHRKRVGTIRRLGLNQAFNNVSFEESHHVKQLQAVDFVAWSLGRLYEKDDREFYDLIRHKESPPL